MSGDNNLRRFERRVRLVRSWRGLAVGLCFGALAGAAWAALDWMGIAYTDWTLLGVIVAAAGLIGAFVGAVMRVPARSLADSIDRRANLENRLTTSLEKGSDHEGFAEALHQDAQTKVQALKPADLYPVKVGPWHAGAVALSLAAASIFLLGNSPLLLSDEAKAERAEIKKIGQKVERIVKPVIEPKEPRELTAEEKRLADELQKFNRDLEKARMNKKEAIQKANELQKEAEELMKNRAEEVNQDLAKAETAMEKLEKAELEKNGMKIDPKLAKELSQMSEAQKQAAQKDLEQKESQLEAKKQDLQSKLDDINKQLENKGLSEEQRKALEAKAKELQKMLKELEKELAELRKAMQALAENEKIQEMLKQIKEHPAFKELQEIAKKLAEDAAKAQQANPQDPNSEMPKLTKEDIKKMMERMKELQEELEELADQLSDPQALDEYMEALKEALKNSQGMCENGGLCFGLGSLFNLALGLPMPSNAADMMLNDTGRINKNEKGEQGQGKTQMTAVKGERQETGEETYIEIKGPTNVGNRSSVPYRQVLPSYKKKAEKAIDRKSIPKQHEKRVKEYFDSLTGGTKKGK